MVIIDLKKKGNVVRFYLGADSLQTWTGKDWDKIPYQHNAMTVDNKYVVATYDIAFPYNDFVLEPSEHWSGTYSKNDLKNRLVPALLIIEDAEHKPNLEINFEKLASSDLDFIKTVYLGDSEAVLSIITHEKIE